MMSWIHVAPRVQARGGIETILELCRELPAPQSHVALFDRGPSPRPEYANLAANWRMPLAVMRRRFRAALTGRAGALVIYHNGWGLPLFHDLDGAARRVVVLHADPAFHLPDLPAWAGLVDGVLGSCPGLAGLPPRCLPGLSDDRCEIYRMPAALSVPLEPRPAAGNGLLVLGFAGRLERGQKCLHLLPDLLAALRARGVRFRFEIVGEGPLRPWLAQRAGPEVSFLGWIDPVGAYHRRLGTWDAAVYFSENEGGPIALLEAMGAGAIPFYPRRSGSWADHHVPAVDLRCHYAPGDMTGLARAIADIFAPPAATIDALRARARARVADHTPAQFLSTTAGFLARIAQQPRISARRSRRPRLTDWLPLGFATRAWVRALRRS